MRRGPIKLESSEPQYEAPLGWLQFAIELMFQMVAFLILLCWQLASTLLREDQPDT